MANSRKIIGVIGVSVERTSEGIKHLRQILRSYGWGKKGSGWACNFGCHPSDIQNLPIEFVRNNITIRVEFRPTFEELCFQL